MKILQIVPSYKPAYQYGGTIESVARLCEGLVQAGIDVQVFTTTANGTEELDVKTDVEYIVEGVRVIYFTRLTKDHSHITFSLWKRLYKDCKKYDVVHIHSWWNLLVLVAALICKKQKVKTIISPHGMLSDYIIQHSKSYLKRITHSIIGRSLLKYATLHATSDAELAECNRLIPGWEGFMLPNIIWLPEMNIKKQGNKMFTIIFLSRIHPKKGIELLMQAISKVGFKVCLQVVGTGEKHYIKDLKLKAKELGIEDQIEWLGWINRDEKFEILMQADLFALTSYNENFANVVVESLHVGTSVLLSSHVGLSKFVASNNLGWVCGLDTEDIRDKLETAILNAEHRKKISTCAPEIIKLYFSEEILIPEYLHNYKL